MLFPIGHGMPDAIRDGYSDAIPVAMRDACRIQGQEEDSPLPPAPRGYFREGERVWGTGATIRNSPPTQRLRS